MAESLLAILLVTTSAKGANLVFRWPPFPQASPRLCRPKPDNQVFESQLDNPWRASLSHQNGQVYASRVNEDDLAVLSENGIPKLSIAGGGGNANTSPEEEKDYANDPEYRWQRPGDTSSHPTTSAKNNNAKGQHPPKRDGDPYEHVLGYSCEFLATLLCPQKSMCHQRFELIVDDLAFIGHPVCAEDVPRTDAAAAALNASASSTQSGMPGCWSFRPEKVKATSRGRDKESPLTGHGQTADGGGGGGSRVSMPVLGLGGQQLHTHTPLPGSNMSSQAGSPDRQAASYTGTSSWSVPVSNVVHSPPPSSSAWLERFQLVLVLDLPDPSSSASGNIAKYFEVIYEQIAFTFTAILFQEQVMDNYVERECDALIALQERLLKKEEPYTTFVEQAVQISTIASAMKTLYEAIKARSIAYISLNAIPLELQLPPHLDDLLHGEGEVDIDSIERPEDDEMQNWGPELSFGWKLPGLAPWKSLLLLEGESDMDLSLRGGGSGVSGEERALAENVARFLDAASITISLSELGNSLDWDLEGQVYPVVRWLVLHRKAKVVDTVNVGLKTIFALPSKFSQPLATLAEEFRGRFGQQFEIPTLPQILATISSSLAKQSDNHFFASVVKKKDLVPVYQEVVEWMLRRDMLVTLHLRIRIVATRELKKHVYEMRQRALARRARRKPIGRESVQGASSRAATLERGRSGSGRGPGSGISSLRRGGGGGGKFDEFDEDGERVGSGSAGAGSGNGNGGSGSGSNKTTPSGLTAFMSLSPPKRNASGSGGSGSKKSRGRSGRGTGSGGSAKGASGGLRRLSSADSRGTSISELVIQEEEDDDLSEIAIMSEEDDAEGYLVDDDDGHAEGEDDDDESDLSGSDEEESFEGSMINDPGRATPRQRRWLTAMSEGQELHIAKRFEQINQYFDGKRSDDEILYRAEITRRQLREVLHHYEPYLQTFLHPS